MNSIDIEPEPKITCVIGKNNYKDYLVYNILYEHLKTDKYKFGVVIGNAYPYCEYFSDNIYIKYEEQVLNNYFENIFKLYNKTNGNIDNNLLIIDTNEIDLNSYLWVYFLDFHKRYKTDVILIMDKINEKNMDKLKMYVDILYILKSNYNNHFNNIYNTFFKYMLNIEEFREIYKTATDKIMNVLCVEFNENKYYVHKINLDIPRYIFNTYKIYDEQKLYKQRCIVSDIINV